MTIEKSILTHAVLMAGIVLTFILSFLRRRNIKYSALLSAFFVCCHTMLVYYILPFPLNFKSRVGFDQYFTHKDIFLVPDFENPEVFIFAYIPLLISALIMGICTPMLFKSCRNFHGSIRVSIIPFFMNAFFLVMDLIMGGLYQYVDICIIILFEAAFYIGFIPMNKFCSKFFDSFDRSNAKQKNFDGVI